MESGERTKIVIVIGLAAIFLSVGYFRFLHGKITFFGKPDSGIALPAAIEVPAVDLAGNLPVAGLKKTARKGPRGSLRDIFSPPKVPAAVIPPVTVSVAVAVTVTPKPLPSLKLTGTIAGGKRPLAVINDRLLRNGEVIDGYRIVSIARDHVILSGEGRRVVVNHLTGIEELLP